MKKLSYFIILIFVFFIGCGLWKAKYPLQNKGDITFSHKKHTEMEAECGACHTQITESKLASDNNYPKEKDCLECHEREKCSICHSDVNNAIHLMPVPTGLLFSHKAHLESNNESLKEARQARANSLNKITPFVKNGSLDQKIDCSICHALVKDSTNVADKFTPEMRTCRKCHEITQDDCNLCHDNLGDKKFIPASHYIGWLQRHKLLAAAEGEGLCESCHRGKLRSPGAAYAVTEAHISEEDTKVCAECHRGDIWPEAIHDNNRIQSHGIDAMANQSVCNSCHQREECITCHERRGLSFFDVHPAGWQLNHADKARRQLSSCVACHKEEDCLGCHQAISPHPPGWDKEITERNERVCLKCHVK
jgi:hypothetical protein